MWIFPIQKFMALVAFGSICSQTYPTEKTHVTSSNIPGVCALTEVYFPACEGERENAPPAKFAEFLGRAWPRNPANSEGRTVEWRAARPNRICRISGAERGREILQISAGCASSLSTLVISTATLGHLQGLGPTGPRTMHSRCCRIGPRDALQ